MPKDYDVEEAFRAIENELINSMMRNLSHHRAEEMKEGLNWTSWQAEQLKALNVYKQKNQKKFTKIFADINRNIEKSILLHRRTGETEQEKAILEAIKKGAKLTHKAGSTIEGAFFRINDRKLDALLNEVNSSMRKAETAMLRMANDQYRKVIFNSQIYYNTGAGTYEKAVDMATKDFLSRGINCIEYKNGARVNIASYAGMALRTANTRAYCQGEGTKRQEWGITTVIVNKRGLPCPKCGRWTGKILIDDVWSGGKASDGPYPLMSQAMAGGLYHPNCKDGHTTYFPGISAKPEKVTKKEMKRAVIAEKQENRDNLIQRNIDKFDRLSNYSLDEENKKQYAVRKEQWEEQAQSLKNDSEYQNAKVRAGVKNIEKLHSSDIMKSKEIFRKMDDTREGFKFISDKTFDKLTIQARKNGAIILRGTKELEVPIAYIEGELRKLVEWGYIADGENQVTVINVKDGNLVTVINNFVANHIQIPKFIFEEGKKVDERLYEVNKSKYPEHLEKLVRYNNSNAFTWGEFIPYIVERMLEVGMLKPLTQKQKKAVFTVVAIDC